MTHDPPAADAAAIARLRDLEVLDSAPEPVFDRIARLAADLCGAPISLLTLLDETRQWFKSNVGLDGVTQTPREVAFCVETCRGTTVFEVPDAERDQRFAANPLVRGSPGIRFYAGAPIAMPAGERIGALCVIDRVPRQLAQWQRTALSGLADIAVAALLERKRRLELDRELTRSEARYRLIVEGQTELVSLARPDGTLSFVNLAYAEFFGLRPDDMLGRNLLDFVPEADRSAVSAHLQRVVSQRTVASGVNRMQARDGTVRWVAWTNRCVVPADGAAPIIQSVGRDITAQRQAEEALAASEQRHRLLYEATPAMLHSIDAQGRLVDVSDRWLRTLGYERAEVIGRPSVDFLSPASRTHARTAVLPEFFRTGLCESVDYQMVRKDGSVVEVQMSAILERDADGAPLRSLAVTQDVTERKATAASLAETTHVLQLVLDSLPARISYWDRDSRNQFANQSFMRAFGLGQRRIEGCHAREVLGEAWYERIRPSIDAGLGGQPVELEIPMDTADRQRRYLDMRFTPDLREGEVHGLFVFALDVTEQHLARQELAQRDARFKLLVEGIRDYAIYMLDADGRVATWNAGAERIEGYREEQILGQHYGVFFAPEDRAGGKPGLALEEAARVGRYEAEDWRVRADGTRYWAGVLLTALRDEQRRLVGYAKITRDLTERRRQQALVDRAVELAPCAMLIVGADGTILMANAQAEATFGYPRAELLGRSVDTLIPASARMRHAGLRRGYAHHPATRTMGAGRELRALRSDGREVPVEVGLSPIELAGGQATLAAVFDITERRRQQALTEQALAEKETLLKEVYHRVKNNLQVVQSLLSLQGESQPAGPGRSAIEECVLRVRAMALVHEKLYQAGNLASVSLAGYTKDLVAQLAEAQGVDRGRIRLHEDVGETNTGLDYAIPFGLLLTELITNCLKHGFPNGRAGEVRVSLAKQEGGHLLTVADTGVGFPEGFDPAVRTPSMGLQLAHSLARQLGGELLMQTRGGATVQALLRKL